MPKMLFIQPTQYGVDGKLCKQKKIYLPGLVFPLLASMTPDNWEVSVKIEVVDDLDFNEDADLVGIGTMGYTIYRALEIASHYRKRGIPVVLGGYMASMVVEESLKHVDSVVVGDAEISYPKLLADYERTGRIESVYDNRVENLAGLPVPRYELLTEKPIGNMLPVQAGRGCVHKCSFCSIACIYKGRYLTRPVDEVLRDIQAVKDLGFKRFYLLDDNIVSNPPFFRALCSELEPLKMTWATQCSINLARNPRLLEAAVRAGCNLLSLGIESITQEGLDLLDKRWLKVEDHEELLSRIYKAGIMPSTEMMLGTDSDTEESIRATLDFVERNKLPIPRFYILTPIPGSELHEELRQKGRLTTEDLSKYDGSTCVHRPERISPEKVTELYWWLNQRVFSLWSILKRTLLKREALKNPLLHLFAFGVNLHYRHYIKRKVPPNIF